MEPITIKFTLDSETKGTFKFKEASSTPVVGMLYIKKGAFTGTPPAVLSVTISKA